jgi:mercuric ion transport protein
MMAGRRRPHARVMVRSIARRSLPFAAAAFVACAILQVFLAGLGVFDDPGSFVTHREFGYTFGWLTLLVLVLALVGRSPRRITGLCALLLVLFAFQSVFVALRTDYPAIAALHPLNGFAILGVGVVITRQAWAVRRVPMPERPEASATSATSATVGDVG